MFRKDDEVIEFLEQTMEISIPQEILKDKKETLQIIENHLEIKIPKQYRKKKKLEKYLEKMNQEYFIFKRKRKPEKIMKICLFCCLYLLPVCLFLWKITQNTSIQFLKKWDIYLFISIIVLIISSILMILLIGFSHWKRKTYRLKHSTIMISSIFVIYMIGILSFIELLYGQDQKYQDRIISEFMNTSNYQYIASIFYSNHVIENTLSKESSSMETENHYEFEPIDYEINQYANPYEKEILTKENENDLYKIIKVEGTLRDGVTKYSGYMTVVYDPSHVKIATSIGAGTTEGSFGQILSQISKDNNALVAMNAGGFYDPDWSSNGGIPHGTVIQDGEIKTEYSRGIESGGMIGFNQENQLVLKRMSAEEAISMGIRDAVDWGPFLIVNGKNYFLEETSKWACARSVIGQRKDGIVLMLVIDGDQPHSQGASYSDLADIMERYGAYNAANLDGGTSTAMVENHEYINIPFNGQRRTIRSLPNAWIVTSN